MLLVDGVYILLDVVIANPIQVDLVLQVALSHGVVAIVVAQVKNGLYCDQFLLNMFFPLVIEVFGCLYQQQDEFFHQCANMAWGAKGIGILPLSILHAFYKQKVSMTLHVVFILKCVVMVGEGSSRLGVLSKGPPVSLFDMLFMT